MGGDNPYAIIKKDVGKTQQKPPNKSNMFYAILFGLMLIPKSYYITNYIFNGSVNIGGTINPLLLIIMMVAIMKDGLRGNNIGASIKMYIVDLLPKPSNKEISH